MGDYAPYNLNCTSTVSGGQVCTDTNPLCDWGTPLFTGYLTDASGHKCSIKPIYYSDTKQSSGNVTVNVQIQQPCNICGE